MKTLLGLMLGVSTVVLAASCGSEDAKKKSSIPGGQGGSSTAGSKGGGEAGDSSSGGSGGKGGSSAGSKGDGGAAGDNGTGGDIGSAGEAGSGSGGAAGANGGGNGGTGGSGGNCPAGYGECDDNPSTVCEQNLTLVTSCGDCTTTCNSTNASVACQDMGCVITSCNANYGDCDGNPGNGCETSIVSNAAHCGECGRNCAALGSTCSTDKCEEVPMQQGVASGSSHAWAVSSAGIFTANYVSYVVNRSPLDGSATATVWSPSSKIAGKESLLVSGDEVYWAERGTSGVAFTSAVLKKNVTAAAGVLPALVFVPEWQPQFLRLQGNALYWTSGDYQAGEANPNGYVYTRAQAAQASDPGTKIVSVAQGLHGAISAFVTTSNALYWATSDAVNGIANEIRTTPLAGGTPTAVPAVPGGTTTAVYNVFGVAVLQGVGDTLYFSRNYDDSFVNGIYRFKTGDAVPTQLVSAENVITMHVDGAFVYYVLQNTAGVWKAPITGGAGVQITDLLPSKILGSDATFVYVASGANLFKVIK